MRQDPEYRSGARGWVVIVQRPELTLQRMVSCQTASHIDHVTWALFFVPVLQVRKLCM